MYASDLYGKEVKCDENFQMSIQTGVASSDGQFPTDYALSQNYPNPFNPETTIRYALPRPGRVRLWIFDVRGALVRRLVDGKVGAGHHEIRWDGRDAYQQVVASGVYLIRIEAGSFVEQKKMILIR